MTNPLSGQVDIDLDGETVTLVPSLGAALNINRHFGDLQAAANRILARDLHAYIAVVRFGLGIKTEAEAKAQKIEERVFRTGVINLVNPLVDYVLSLGRGGKPADETDNGDASAEGKAPTAG